jgi:hypothetical protein
MPSCCKETTTSFVLDCEAVAWDVKNQCILPFQVLSTRKRKDVQTGDIQVQVCIYAFDILYLNDKVFRFYTSHGHSNTLSLGFGKGKSRGSKTGPSWRI